MRLRANGITVGSLLILASLLASLLIVPAPARADCVLCDMFSSCVADVTASACSCKIRVIRGDTICTEQDFTCTAGDTSSCSSNPPPTLAPRIAIASKVLDRLDEKEHLLGLVLTNTVVHDANRQAFLSLQSYPHGTFRSSDKAYSHRGIFSQPAPGEAAFHFVIQSLTDGSTITYFGILRDQGRSIAYTRITQTSPEAQAERAHFEWRLTD
jgi:hypothetical protein